MNFFLFNLQKFYTFLVLDIKKGSTLNILPLLLVKIVVIFFYEFFKYILSEYMVK